LPFVLADFMDGADVGMIQRRRGTRFAPEALKALSVALRFFGKGFEGHESAEGGVLGFVNHTHPAAAELLQYAVVGNCFTNHLFEGTLPSSAVS
jgi:hypothetical protein